MKKPSLNANLIKKYHQDLVFNYAEYPTCDHWNYNFNSDDYKKAYNDFIKNRLPRKKMGNTDEIMPMIEFLASRSAGMMCGCLIPMDGAEGKSYFI